jgi:hypothetical protein
VHGEELRHALGVDERPVVVDEVVAPVAADAGSLELDRVDRDQPEGLDRRD